MAISAKNWDRVGSASPASAKPTGAEQPVAAWWGRRLAVGVSGGLLIFATLAYGAVHPWAYFTVGLVITALSLSALCLGLWKVWAREGEKQHLPYPPLWWVGLGGVVLTLLQIIPWPQEVLRWMSPAAWEIRALGHGFGLAPHLPLSLNPGATVLEALKLWPAVIMFFLLIFALTSRRQIQALVGLIVGVALFEVLYGFWHYRDHLIWGWKNSYTGRRLCGTFINSNHLAFFLCTAILLGFGLFLSQRQATLAAPGGATGLSRLKRLCRAEHLEPQFRSALWLFLLLLLTVGLIFTGSRGGMLSLVVGFALMSLLIWGERWKRGPFILMAGFVGAALLYSLFLGSSQYLARFQDLTDLERYHAMKGALSIFSQYPWTGSGIGTFGELFYQFAPAELHGKYFIYTHNDWLQLLAEAGVGGFLLLAAAWGVFFSGLVRQWRQRRDGFARNVGLGGIAALTAGVFSALGEFPFHIPALSLLFATAAAITYLALYSREEGGWDYFTYPAIIFPGRRSVTFLALLGLLGLQLAFGFQIWYQWRAELAAPTAINSTRPPAKAASQDFRRAQLLNPRNGSYPAGLAAALEKEGPGAAAALTEAEQALQAAILSGPSHWGYRQQLAEFSLRQQSHAPAHYLPLALEELAAAVKLFPQSGALHFRLGTVLGWTETYYPELVPAKLRGQGEYHLNQAMKLQPELKKYIKNFKG